MGLLIMPMFLLRILPCRLRLTKIKFRRLSLRPGAVRTTVLFAVLPLFSAENTGLNQMSRLLRNYDQFSIKVSVLAMIIFAQTPKEQKSCCAK
jgi:hypothetical protein